jgi:hypothetical protein
VAYKNMCFTDNLIIVTPASGRIYFASPVQFSWVTTEILPGLMFNDDDDSWCRVKAMLTSSWSTGISVVDSLMGWDGVAM